MTPAKDMGLTLKPSRVSQAFSLITFMVCELIFVEKSLPPPINLESYSNLNENDFNTVRDKVLNITDGEEVIELNIEESTRFYQLIDLTCKCMVNDEDDVLKDLAQKNIDIESDEYEKVRNNYLKYAQSLLDKMNKKFSGQKVFDKATKDLRD